MKQEKNLNKKKLVCEFKVPPHIMVLLQYTCTVQTVVLHLIMLNANEYSFMSTYTTLCHLLAWFLTFWRRLFITCKQAGKQALSRFTGAPSLIANMWKYVFRSKISGIPSRPCQSSVSLSANMQTNTCTKGHMLPSEHCILKGMTHVQYTTNRYSSGLRKRVCVYVHAYISSPLSLCTRELTSHYSFNGTLTNPENKGEPWQCSCYPSPLQSCINNS